MKTVINDTYTHRIIVAKHFDEPVFAEGATSRTPFLERYKYIEGANGLAEFRGKLTAISIYTDTDDGRTIHTALNINEISAIAKFYNEYHGQLVDPDYPTEEED